MRFAKGDATHRIVAIRGVVRRRRCDALSRVLADDPYPLSESQTRTWLCRSGNELIYFTVTGALTLAKSFPLQPNANLNSYSPSHVGARSRQLPERAPAV